MVGVREGNVWAAFVKSGEVALWKISDAKATGIAVIPKSDLGYKSIKELAVVGNIVAMISSVSYDGTARLFLFDVKDF